jgi:hypothetical protein
MGKSGIAREKSTSREVAQEPMCARAVRIGSGETITNPSKGRSISRIRKIAADRE